MGKILIVAEKPSAGADIAKVVCATERNDGYLEGDRYVVTWGFGHLIGLKEPQEHDEKYKAWSLDTLPIYFDINDSLKIIPSSAKQFKTISKLIHRKDIDMLINAGDAGREGYLIQKWIYRMADSSLPEKVLWASSLTHEGILSALNNLKEDENKEFKAILNEAEARAEGDYILGMNYSRLLTLTRAAGRVTLSYGRCQTPLLNLIVKRDEIMENFKPEPFWDVKARYNAGFEGTLVDDSEKVLHFMKKEEAEAVISSLSGKNGHVVSYISEEKTKKAPLLFNLAKLQQEMGKKYKFSPEKTLKICQSLYENHKILSYPRTDSQYLSMDVYNEIGSHIKSCRFGEFASIVDHIDLDNISPDKSYFNDLKVTDHHALIPTINPNMEAIYNSLSDDERKVFYAIVMSLLAIFYPVYRYQAAKVIIDINGRKFLSKGYVVIDLGYKAIYGSSNEEENDNKEIELPKMDEGTAIAVSEVSFVEKQTKPPGYYNDESIIKIMEKYNIGTSATRGEIIAKLQKQFIQRDDKKGMYSSTELGREYIKVVPDSLKDPDFTNNFEKGLMLINKGELSKKDFLQALIEEIKRNITLFTQNPIPDEQKLGYGLEKSEILGKCPHCGGNVKTGHYGIYCENKCGMNVSKIMGVMLSADQVKALLMGQKTYLSGLPKKAGGTFSAYIIPKGTEAYSYSVSGKEYSGYQFSFDMEFKKTKRSK